eukprot:COSAG02_NODE_27156_length_616_cov_0.690522_1_plen_69_part_10
MGTRMYYKFYGKDLEDARALEARIDLLTREIGDRGKTSSRAASSAGVSTGRGPSTVPSSAPRTPPAHTL